MSLFLIFFGQPESFLCLGGEESIIEPCSFSRTKMEFSHLYEEKHCTFDGFLGWNPLKKEAGHAFYIGDFFVEKEIQNQEETVYLKVPLFQF